MQNIKFELTLKKKGDGAERQLLSLRCGLFLIPGFYFQDFIFKKGCTFRHTGWQTVRNMADMVKVEHLKKNFGDLEVLKDINLTVAEGEKLVIIGPSGSGKSTFIRCINHLEEPTSGTISIAGTPVTKKNRLEMAKNILPWYSSSSTCIHT